jgi:hypothetical protein
MQVAVLTPLEDGSFKPQKIEIDSKLGTKSMLSKPKNFLICTKSCNGTYYPVFSEVQEVITEHKKRPNGLSKSVLRTLGFDEDMHGQRFLIFKNGKEAYLLGDVVAASKKLSK